MKKFARILILTLLASTSAFAEAPKYTLTSNEVLGDFEELTTESCKDETGRPCVVAQVTKKDGTVTIELLDYRHVKVSLKATKSGRLVFKWENPKDDDCDDPGCWNLLGINGVIYPKKKGDSYVPGLRLFVSKQYLYPESEEDPSGNVVEVENYIKRK